MEYEIISGRRINSQLLYSISEQQLYKKKSIYKKSVFYVCYEKNCKSRVYLLESVLCKYADFIDHNHGSQKSLYDELKALNTIKKSCLNINCADGQNALTGIRETFRNVCNSSQEATRNIDFNKIQRGLQYIASTVYMTSPKTPNEVQVAFQKDAVFKNFGCTRHNDGSGVPFFKICHEEKDFAYCVFLSDKSINIIKENIPDNVNRKILIDGTFAVVPIGCFKQLIIIAVEYLEKTFPFAFILMNKKCNKGYIHLFKYINAEILNLEGATFISDYEQSLRKGIRESFSGCKLIGCWFHFCQAIRRQIATKNKDLAKFIREDKKASLAYHKILSIPLLPSNYITTSYEAIKREIEKFDSHLNFVPFCRYFENQWLEKVGPEGISVSNCSTRTTASLEAYNGVLGKMIPKQGNFFKFVQILQGEEFSKSREFEQFVESGGSFGKIKRRKTSIEKGAKIEKAMEDLKKGIINVSTFLNRMVYSKNDVCTGMEPDEDLFEENIYLEEDDEEVEMENIQTNNETQLKLCVVCIVEEPNTLLLPCRHMKVCNECVMKLQAQAISNNEQHFNCPVCRQVVTETMQVFL